MAETQTLTLRQAVEAWLHRTGRTQSDWARELGCTRQRVQQVLDGVNEPSLPLALRMSRTTGIPIEAFAGEPIMPARRRSA